MTTYYVEYPIEGNNSVLVEVEDRSGTITRASNKSNTPLKSRIGFAEAFKSAKSSITELIAELGVMNVEEAEIKFGLKSVGEAGIFAIGKVGGEMNYEITLRWKKPAPKTPKKRKPRK
jgi:hypothetical protein